MWRTLTAEIPAGTPIETVMKPDYWAHYTRDIRPMDILWPYCEDASWEANLRVQFVSSVEVKTKLLWKVEHEKADDVVESETHEVVWKGPAVKYAVVHKDTGEVIKNRLFPKSEAHNFLRRHLQELKD